MSSVAPALEADSFPLSPWASPPCHLETGIEKRGHCLANLSVDKYPEISLKYSLVLEVWGRAQEPAFLTILSADAANLWTTLSDTDVESW